MGLACLSTCGSDVQLDPAVVAAQLGDPHPVRHGPVAVALPEQHWRIPTEMRRHALTRAMVRSLNIIHREVMPVMLPTSVILGCGFLFIPKHSCMHRTLIEYYAIWYLVRILMAFILMVLILINLLLFIPVPDHSLLALQVVLFFPAYR